MQSPQSMDKIVHKASLRKSSLFNFLFPYREHKCIRKKAKKKIEIVTGLWVDAAEPEKFFGVIGREVNFR